MSEGQTAPKRASAAWTPLGIVGGVIGIALGRFLGLIFLVPILGFGAAAWQTGQLVLFAVGAIFIDGGWRLVWIDVVILVAPMVWLYLTDSRLASAALVAVQTFGAGLNIWQFTQTPLLSEGGKGLIV